MEPHSFHALGPPHFQHLRHPVVVEFDVLFRILSLRNYQNTSVEGYVPQLSVAFITLTYLPCRMHRALSLRPSLQLEESTCYHPFSYSMRTQLTRTLLERFHALEFFHAGPRFFACCVVTNLRFYAVRPSRRPWAIRRHRSQLESGFAYARRLASDLACPRHGEDVVDECESEAL